jgi:endo-1,4-beta-xylanase
MYELHRRTLLYGLAATAAIGGSPKAVHGAARSETLRNVAVRGGVTYGAATSEGLLSGVPKFAAKFAQQCQLAVPENDGKWMVIHPSANAYNFAPLDHITSFAAQHGMMTHGHTLVWHYNPSWLIPTLQNSNQAQSLLTDHIATVLSHYAGRIVSWDVVNEAIDPASGRADGLRDSPWLDALGPSYIQKAFEAARNTDPKVKLVYNDYGIEYARPDHAVKRKLVLELLRNLRRASFVDALGIQSHLWLGESFEPAVFASWMSMIAPCRPT